MKTIFTIVLILSAFLAEAQIRHVKGIKAVDATYGISKFGTVYNLGYVRYFSNNSYIKALGFFEKGVGSGIEYQSSGVEVMYARTLLHSGASYYLNAVGGAHFSLDQVNSTQESFDINDTFKPGILIGIENEVFISDKFVFILGFTQRALIGEQFGNYRFFTQAGIRYNF